MMQADYLPFRRLIEYEATGVAWLRRSAIVDEASLRLARRTGGWAFVLNQLVILQRKRKLAAFGMANYVNALVICGVKLRRAEAINRSADRRK